MSQISSRRTERPIFWIYAGPNGSGKTSAYKKSGLRELAQSIWIINPDALTLRIQEVEKLTPTDANFESVKRIERWLEDSIRAHQSVGVETVLSTSKYRRLVELAKRFEFRINLTYFILDSPKRNIERVHVRVTKGGHAVPDDKIVSRYWRSLEQLPWFLDAADEAWIFDNSGTKSRLIAEKSESTLQVESDALPVIHQAAERVRSGQF